MPEIEQGIINATSVSLLYTASELNNHFPYRWPNTSICCIHRQVVLRLDTNSLIWQYNWKWPTRYPVAQWTYICNRHLKCTSYYVVNSNLVNFPSPMAFSNLSNRFEILNKHGNIIAVLLAKFQNNLTNTPAMITTRVWFEITLLINV